MRNAICLLLLLCANVATTQTDSLTVKNDTLEIKKPWVQKNKVNLDVNEVAFVNWNSGGVNSVSALLGVLSSLKHEKEGLIWNNTISGRYGINKQQAQDVRKTDDLIEINSSLGYKKDTLTNWYYTAKFNFKSQFSNGYSYPNQSKPISKFMAPGYLFFGTGMEYGRDIETFSFYFSPLTVKGTFVLDDDLANAGAFGVESAVVNDNGDIIKEGEKVRTEVGILITNAYETVIFENIALKNALSLYTDYFNSFGNVDVNWEINLDFKVNAYVKATLGSHLKYDNDTKTQVEIDNGEELAEEGAKVQWKQQIGIGVTLDF
ncbi:DUF3078 domain-containing protein [Pontimicrobium sp. MEBiC06410]